MADKFPIYQYTAEQMADGVRIVMTGRNTNQQALEPIRSYDIFIPFEHLAAIRDVLRRCDPQEDVP